MILKAFVIRNVHFDLREGLLLTVNTSGPRKACLHGAEEERPDGWLSREPFF